MRESFHCRRCERSQALRGSGRGAFVIAGAKPHYGPDLPFRLEHVKLGIEIDPRTRAFQAVTTQTYRVVAADQSRLRLDQVDLTIHEVKVQGQAVPFAIDGRSLLVELPEAVRSLAAGSSFECVIGYEGHNPRRGLYFTGPDQHYPKKPFQVWSQGQDEDNRYWIPLPDFPNQKATTEIVAKVPRGYTAVSNGALISRAEEGEWTRFHYKLGTPHVTYLISLVVAELEDWQDEGPGGLPVQYFVPKGRKADGARAFANTPRMIEAFARRTGVPFPYEKYSQTAVQDFIFGGMENTSATTQTDRTLHDARAHIDFKSDPLVSHELAHQWFGDLVTCRDWSHGWLNEGFATFMERVWLEESEGADEAKYYQYIDLKEYLSEDATRYRRPIVCRTYIEPIDLFDMHLYQKGGLVLNLIRSTLGEEQFWKAIRLYLERHRGGSVETIDLIRAIEDATGRNLRRLFDQWVFSAGHPEFELSYQWHEDKKLAELVIEQKQTGGKPELIEHGFVTPVFQVPVRIELTLQGRKTVAQTIELREPRERVFLHADSKPLMIRFDPDFTIPKTIKFPRPKELLVDQLENDRDCMGRIEAALELARVGDAHSAQALSRALLRDPFWGVQAEVAEALAEIRTAQARDALIAGLKIPHPKARRAVVKALGAFRDEVAAEAVRATAEKDPSYFVEAEGTLAYAKARARLDAVVTEDFLLKQLSKESYLEVIRGAALRALAELPGISRGERPRAMAALEEWTRLGKPLDARLAAVGALGHVARMAAPGLRAEILRRLDELADEDNFRIRMKLVAALGESETPEAPAILSRIHERDADGRVKRDALAVRAGLLTSGSLPESVGQLRSALERLEEEQRKLKAKFEENLMPPEGPRR